MDIQPNLMRYKLVKCGDVVEIYRYKVPIECGKSREYDVIRKQDDDEENSKRADNLYRARQNVRRIVWSNQGNYTKFVTLTYAETMLDVKTVRRDITTFVQNMRRLDYQMKYLYILEHQKERGEKEGNAGSLHVHMLIFIDKYIPYADINKCWKKGSTDIEAIENINNLGAYVCKYITKETLTEFGKHSYERSQNLRKSYIERFYVGGYSDSAIDIQGEDVLQALNINYNSTMHYDYISPTDGSAQSQEVSYWQGTIKDFEILKRIDLLYEVKGRLDNLHLSQNE